MGFKKEFIWFDKLYSCIRLIFVKIDLVCQSGFYWFTYVLVLSLILIFFLFNICLLSRKYIIIEIWDVILIKIS